MSQVVFEYPGLTDVCSFELCGADKPFKWKLKITAPHSHHAARLQFCSEVHMLSWMVKHTDFKLGPRK